jgi:2-hydroxychromene-2-carboxylate isomerase
VAYELDDHAQALANVAQTEGFTLPVYIDLKAPQSYLALDSTMAMAGDNNISLDWYFFAGQPLRKPAAALASEDRSGKHRRIRAQYIASEMQCYAPHQLKDLYAVERSDSASLALVWIKQTYAQDIVDAYVKAVLQRFWLHNEDVDSMSSIKALMTDLGLSLQGFDQFLLEVGPKALNQNLREMQDLAISVSPTYLIGTEPFQGRQHLPLLAARLGSKN